jgi:hypothetical protein
LRNHFDGRVRRFLISIDASDQRTFATSEHGYRATITHRAVRIG